MELCVQDPWWGLIAQNRKTVEIRVGAAEKYCSAEEVTVRCEGGVGSFRARVVGVRAYATLKDALDAEWQQAAPQAGSREEAEALYLGVRMRSRGAEKDGAPLGEVIRVFSPERVAHRGGLCAIRLEPFA